MHADKDVLGGGQVVVEPDALESAGHSQGRDFMSRLPVEALIAEPDRAAFEWEVPGGEIDQRRFSGTVGSDQPESSANRDFEADVLNSLDPAKVAGYALKPQQRRHASRTTTLTATSGVGGWPGRRRRGSLWAGRL